MHICQGKKTSWKRISREEKPLVTTRLQEAYNVLRSLRPSTFYARTEETDIFCIATLFVSNGLYLLPEQVLLDVPDQKDSLQP